MEGRINGGSSRINEESKMEGRLRSPPKVSPAHMIFIALSHIPSDVGGALCSVLNFW